MNITENELNEFMEIYDMSKIEILEYIKLITISFENRGLSTPSKEDYETCLEQACTDDKLYRKTNREINKDVIADKAVAGYIAHGQQQSDITYRDLIMFKKMLGNKSKVFKEEQPSDGNEPNIFGKK